MLWRSFCGFEGRGVTVRDGVGAGETNAEEGGSGSGHAVAVGQVLARVVGAFKTCEVGENPP